MGVNLTFSHEDSQMQGQTCTPSAIHHTTADPSISLAPAVPTSHAVKQPSVDRLYLWGLPVNRLIAFILEAPKNRSKDANL
jgi:hypothetical protein